MFLFYQIEGPESGRSTPHSRLSSKYRASIESTRQSIAERRSTSPRLAVPDVASFEDAELDENAEYPMPAESKCYVINVLFCSKP